MHWAADAELVRIVDARMAEAVQRGAAHVVCRPGCAECCHGVFAIDALDAARLQRALSALHQQDPERAARVLQRSRATIAAWGDAYPGDRATGALVVDERFDDFANEDACPALDPATRHCDLYDARPLTCREFGPAVLDDGAVKACELCYEDASDEEIAACAVTLDIAPQYNAALRSLDKTNEAPALTVVAYALAATAPRRRAAADRA